MIREQQPDLSHDNFEKFSKEAQDLAMRMLNKNPAYRITPAQALQHPFFKVNKISVPKLPPTLHELVSKQKIRRAAAVGKAKERAPRTTSRQPVRSTAPVAEDKDTVVSLSADGVDLRVSKRSSMKTDREPSKGTSQERTNSKETSLRATTLAMHRVSSQRNPTQRRGDFQSAFRTNQRQAEQPGPGLLDPIQVGQKVKKSVSFMLASDVHLLEPEVAKADEGKRRISDNSPRVGARRGRAVKHGLVTMVLEAAKEQERLPPPEDKKNSCEHSGAKRSSAAKSTGGRRELKQVKSRSSDVKPGEGLAPKDEHRGSSRRDDGCRTQREGSLGIISVSASSGNETVEGVGEAGPSITELHELADVPVVGGP